MSSDHGLGAPSFGDLFEDPDAPATAETAAPTPAAAPAPARAAAPHDADDAPAAPAAPAAQEHSDPDLAEPADGPDRAAPGHDEPPGPGRRVAPTTPVPAPDAEADGGASDDAAREVPAAAAVLAAGAVTVTPTGSVTVAPAAPVTASTTTPPAPSARPDAPAAPRVPAPAAQPAWDGTADPAASSAPAPRVDTGRLYRSSGAEGPATLDAIPAIDPDRPPARPARRVDRPAASPARIDAGLTYSGVVVVVGVVTVLAAFVEALLRHQLGAITGLALLASSVYAAVVVRRPDIWAAVVVPPLAFLAAALTAGQLTLDKAGSLLIREGFAIFRALATNAPWILGTTAICLAIVLVRRRRA